MQTAIIVSGHIGIHACERIEGETVLSTDCRDFDAYKALPTVVSYDGAICVKTGWNSDRGVAYYKSGRSHAIARVVQA